MIPMVYIMGTSHSGSTLLSFLMNGHPDMICMGESSPSLKRLHDRDQLNCSCGEVIGACPFWNKIFEEAWEKGVEFKPDSWKLALINHRPTRNLLFRKRPDAFMEFVRKTGLLFLSPHIKKRNAEIATIIDTILEVSGKSIFVDASKSAARLELLLRNPRLDIKTIWLVRDVRAVSNSLLRKNYDVPQAAVHWTKTQQGMKNLFNKLPESERMLLKYEDLCTDPEAAIAEVFRFSGAEAFKLPADFKDSVHHIIGNNMRLRSVSTIQLDEKWKTRLSDSEKQLALEAGGDLAAELGYK